MRVEAQDDERSGEKRQENFQGRKAFRRFTTREGSKAQTSSAVFRICAPTNPSEICPFPPSFISAKREREFVTSSRR